MGKLTTHVLDTATGKPAAGVRVVLRCGEQQLVDAMTNSDGRLDKPLLDGDALVAGRYTLTFYTADYFRGLGTLLDDPPFLDEVFLAFGIAHPDQHYHVPLLASPWSFTTYRGS